MGSSSSKPEVWPWGSAPSWMVTWKHTLKTTTVYPNKKNPWTFQIPHEVIHSFAYFGYLYYWKTRSLFDLSSDSQSWFVSSPEAPPIKKPTMKMCCACPETKVFGSGQRWMLTMTSQLIRYYLQCFLVWSVVIWYVCMSIYLCFCVCACLLTREGLGFNEHIYISKKPICPRKELRKLQTRQHWLLRRVRPHCNRSGSIGTTNDESHTLST